MIVSHSSNSPSSTSLTGDYLTDLIANVVSYSSNSPNSTSLTGKLSRRSTRDEPKYLCFKVYDYEIPVFRTHFIYSLDQWRWFWVFLLHMDQKMLHLNINISSPTSPPTGKITGTILCHRGLKYSFLFYAKKLKDNLLSLFCDIVQVINPYCKWPILLYIILICTVHLAQNAELELCAEPRQTMDPAAHGEDGTDTHRLYRPTTEEAVTDTAVCRRCCREGKAAVALETTLLLQQPILETKEMEYFLSA